MALRKIVKHGDPLLRKKCDSVNVIDKEIKKLVQDMLETMYAAPGIGLAANQIGISLAIAVIDIQPQGKPVPLVLINPKIIELSGTLFEEEGCLSIPGFLAQIKRSAFAKVSALNLEGMPMIYTGEGLLSRAFQHETDHLNGKFYIDHLSVIKRLKIQSDIKKLRKKGNW